MFSAENIDGVSPTPSTCTVITLSGTDPVSSQDFIIMSSFFTNAALIGIPVLKSFQPSTTCVAKSSADAAGFHPTEGVTKTIFVLDPLSSFSNWLK